MVLVIRILRLHNSNYWKNLKFDSYIVAEDDLSLGGLRLLEVDHRVKLPVLVLAIGVANTFKIKTFEYYILVLLGFLGLCLLTCSTDILSVYLCLELITLSFYILATFQRSSAFSTEAGLKYFLLGAISSALVGLFLLIVSLTKYE